ncbi:hypothetical protein BC828DRAFT_393664 [Blastocladiella britannica]|nr:hypothetical protein BC828DRAFT_393664 [Blastocladiella britannica]
MHVDDGFDSQPAGPALKEYEVEFTVRTLPEILDFQNREAAHVAGIIAIGQGHAATLLRHFTWNKDQLLERYMEDPEKVLRDACVVLDERLAPKIETHVAGFMCEVCCDDDPATESIALSCGHRFCLDCYRRYLTSKIMDDGESRRISCMARDCSLVVDQVTVRELASPEEFAKYQSLLLRTYVDDSAYLRWCPGVGCDNAIECHVAKTKLDLITPTVTCLCGTRFCFGCGHEGGHQPCVCGLVKSWLKKCADDSETANWISANTKQCPKCEATVEKNGGCNHMTCKKCAYHWCWICSGPWEKHGTSYYNCNLFNDKDASSARDAQAKSRMALERYLHYYNRYANNEQSAKLSLEHMNKTEQRMTQMQESTSLSWIEVQFLRSAVETSVKCRNVLKWSFAFAYYMKQENNQTALFEANQTSLQMAVEDLSGHCESEDLMDPAKLPELRKKIINTAVFVEQRSEVMLKDTAMGLREKRWEWAWKP